MTARLEKLYSLIDDCGVFADIGCDHGYISQAVLKGGKAEKVYASDISAASLKKARSLIGDGYKGRFFTFLSDGFDGLPGDVDECLIAGLGGEEICAVLSRAKTLPDTLILQPMKNAEKVRRLVVSLDYGVIGDFTFYAADKYYDVIKAVKRGGERVYSDDEYAYGMDNVKRGGVDFMRFVGFKLNQLTSVFDKIIDENEKARVAREIEKLKGFLR